MTPTHSPLFREDSVRRPPSLLGLRRLGLLVFVSLLHLHPLGPGHEGHREVRWEGAVGDVMVAVAVVAVVVWSFPVLYFLQHLLAVVAAVHHVVVAVGGLGVLLQNAQLL